MKPLFSTQNSLPQNSLHQPCQLRKSQSSFFRSILFIVVTAGLALETQDAAAQITSDGGVVQFDEETGFVGIDNNAFDVQTGDFSNTSRIPLPDGLPETTEEGVRLPVRTDVQAPNAIRIKPDFDYIQFNFDQDLDEDRGVGTYVLDRESLQVTSRFDLKYRPGSHAFGEGIQIIVEDADGEEVVRETAFVRGDDILRGPNLDDSTPGEGDEVTGTVLPSESSLSATYGIDDDVQLRVLNIRGNGFQPSESGIYFAEDGELIVEDLPDGGDLDFDDGEYVERTQGRGEADASVEEEEVTVEETVTETPLDPELREEVGEVESDEITTIVEMDAADEEVVEYGEVELPNIAPTSTRLGHATAARTSDGDVLIYDRYARAGQVRAGSDGLGLTGQLAPLFNNPSAPPTLLTGNVTFNPFVADNEAGVTGTVGITQFLTPTHRQARDSFGNAIANPDGSRRRLLEPTGLFNNRRLMGYVPPTPDESVMGSAISSVGGIFDLPSDQPVMVSAPNAQQVGAGNAAYTNNVGGLLVEETSGATYFVPQWTQAGYAQTPLSFEAGEASRIIYALVPQQAGQNLQLGQTYDVTGGVESYRIADGGFTVISADKQPQNFARETAEVYAVEDTLPNRTNAVTAIFNGIQGLYYEEPGGNRIPTVDVDLQQEVDARVGNTIAPIGTIPGDPGQGAYSRTTFAAGLYLGGSMTGGFGNQRNTVTETGGTVEVAMDELRTQQTFNIFETPLTEVATARTETTTVSRATGQAVFDINERGELTNARFLESDREVISMGTEELSHGSEIVRGEEVLIGTRTEETFEPIGMEILEFDEESVTREESEANFSPVRGELVLGGVMNFGNTPWSAAANTLRTELFARDTVFGRSNSGSEIGWRAEALFHPFGEVRREAYQYDENGNATPVYQTEPMFDASGNRMTETLSGLTGGSVEVPVSQFVTDESGNRIPQLVGTGSPKGPGVYLRAEDSFDDNEGLIFAGGLELSF